MNRKLRKLLRNPRAFVRDMRLVKKIRGTLNASLPENVPLVRQNRIPLAKRVEIAGFEPFELMGENWVESTESALPVAILWGFHSWKRDFVTRYLSEYRVAFAPGNGISVAQRQILETLDSPVFIYWGMNDTPDATQFAGARGIPIYRMEDGFIRSASLGSEHSVALSLVLDRSGIYFDTSRPSDLETLLNRYDFDANPQILEEARRILQLMRKLKISKYSIDGIRSASSVLGPKVRSRILVLGQVEDDASLKFGGGEGWSNRRLIELAREENPQAEILYKPHPDVVRGFRGASDQLQALSSICKPIAQNVGLIDLFSCVDKVYTITSLSGFEALIHGLPVTVVGRPFYAGWGITDDRATLERRERKLGLEEVFCATYLLYPRYLPHPSASVIGALATILKIAADRFLGTQKLMVPEFVEKRAAWIANSEYWPAIMSHAGVEKKYGKGLPNLLPLQKILGASQGASYQRAVAFYLVGKLRQSPALPKLLNELKRGLRPEHFSEVIVSLWKVAPSLALLDHWAWHCERVGDLEGAERSLEHMVSSSTLPTAGANEGLIPPKKHGHALKLAQFQLRQRKLDQAQRTFGNLLLSGFSGGDVFAGLAEIARLRFDFSSSRALLNLLNHQDFGWRAGGGHIWEAISLAFEGQAESALEQLMVGCVLNPQSNESLARIEDVLNRKIGVLPYKDALAAAIEVDSSGRFLARIRALIAAGKPQEAEKLLLEYQPEPNEVVEYSLKLSLAYSLQGKLSAAIGLITELLPLHPTLPIYREALRLSILANDYQWGQRLYNDAVARELEIGDIYHRKIKIGLGDIQGSYLSFRESKGYVGVVQKYLKQKYAQSFEEISAKSPSRILVTALFGPGDELRFASLYPEIMRRLPSAHVTVTCDPRLHQLFCDSFPGIDFQPVKRARNLMAVHDFAMYRELPGSDLHAFFDNRGWALAERADCVVLVTDLLGDMLEGYSSFNGGKYLSANAQLAEQWRRRLPARGKPLVGLSWRSSLRSYARDEHYFEIEQLEKLLSVEGVQFVNLQSDECSDELRYVEGLFPGRLLHFADLDQFNDFDNTAALISCLDLVIAPATTVFELSGGLGVPTWLLSNSSELHWRKRPGTDVDVWHSSMKHIEGETLGDKESVLEKATVQLESWIGELLKGEAA